MYSWVNLSKFIYKLSKSYITYKSLLFTFSDDSRLYIICSPRRNSSFLLLKWCKGSLNDNPSHELIEWVLPIKHNVQLIHNVQWHDYWWHGCTHMQRVGLQFELLLGYEEQCTNGMGTNRKLQYWGGCLQSVYEYRKKIVSAIKDTSS